MRLNKYKIRDLITIIDERNTLEIRDFYGININKNFIPTAANVDGLDETKYKVTRKNRFVYSGMQTGRDESIRIGLYYDEKPILVSPAYTTFEVTAIDLLHPIYFYMLFLSKEMDRYGAFCSDGSIRSNLDWDRFCDIEINLPPLLIQEKYVNIYIAMLANQKNCEKGLKDLKQSFEMYVDKCKHRYNKKKVGDILKAIDNRNTNKSVTNVHGINIDKQFMRSVVNTYDIDLTRYKIVKNGQFAFSGMQTGRDKCIRIALYNWENPTIISPAYTVMENIDSTVLSEYLMIWFSRKEIDRLGWFMSDASIRTNLDLDRFSEIEIPVPELEVQKAIVDIYRVYNQRKSISERLNALIKDICPILIKGSIEEAKREA